MNKKLLEVIEKFNYQGEYADEVNFTYGEDNNGVLYVIFDSNKDRDRFIEECRISTENPDAYDYEIESELEVEFVFFDEYTTCSDCGSVINTEPTHYGWQPDFYVGDGFIICGKCFRSEEDYQEAYLEERINNPKNAINNMIEEEQLVSLGFIKHNNDSYESGLHYGQNDNPEEIYDGLSDKYEEVVFLIDNVGQFDVNYSVWVRGEIF
jgi:hypothetical protein